MTFSLGRLLTPNATRVTLMVLGITPGMKASATPTASIHQVVKRTVKSLMMISVMTSLREATIFLQSTRQA